MTVGPSWGKVAGYDSSPRESKTNARTPCQCIAINQDQQQLLSTTVIEDFMTRTFLFSKATTASIVLMLLAQVVAVGIVSVSPTRADAPSFASAAFERTWARTDQPVANGATNRTWMWGPQANSGEIEEDYAEAPGGKRTVQYFDKSRMEDNSYRTPDAPWDVTNGLLVTEMITGQQQVGDGQFEERMPALANVAGDAGEHPTYFDIGRVLNLLNKPATPVGTVIDTLAMSHILLSAENWGTPPAIVTAAERVTIGGIDHTVASVFWDFMNSSGTIYEDGWSGTGQLFENPYYATGYPITEAYWSNVRIGGVPTTVLWQCFERRCLTYNPNNSPGWQVEAGNVGLHYYQWLHSDPPATPENLELSRNPGTDDFVLTWESQGNAPSGFGVLGINRGTTSETLSSLPGDQHTYLLWPLDLREFEFDCYAVQAFNEAGYSGTSNDACWPDVKLPTTPSNLTLNESTNTLAWTDNGTDEIGFTVWRVELIEGSYWWRRLATVDANATSYSLVGADINKNFCYAVRAFNERGPSDLSNQGCWSSQ